MKGKSYWNDSQLAVVTVKRYATVIAAMRFYYDAEGVPFCFDYNATKYFYITNLQGDIVGIANSNGIVGSYEYDAWGKIIATTSMSSIEESALYYNPLRYRGYIYDTETGFYYLQTRYYDPSIGRFINKWVPPDPRYSKPNSKDDSKNNSGNQSEDNSFDDNTSNYVIGGATVVGSLYFGYVGVKWLVAVLAAPYTGGGSLVIAGATP